MLLTLAPVLASLIRNRRLSGRGTQIQEDAKGSDLDVWFRLIRICKSRTERYRS